MTSAGYEPDDSKIASAMTSTIANEVVGMLGAAGAWLAAR
jgi:hypothetical protein